MAFREELGDAMDTAASAESEEEQSESERAVEQVAQRGVEQQAEAPRWIRRASVVPAEPLESRPVTGSRLAKESLTSLRTAVLVRRDEAGVLRQVASAAGVPRAT